MKTNRNFSELEYEVSYTMCMKFAFQSFMKQFKGIFNFYLGKYIVCYNFLNTQSTHYETNMRRYCSK